MPEVQQHSVGEHQSDLEDIEKPFIPDDGRNGVHIIHLTSLRSRNGGCLEVLNGAIYRPGTYERRRCVKGYKDTEDSPSIVTGRGEHTSFTAVVVETACDHHEKRKDKQLGNKCGFEQSLSSGNLTRCGRRVDSSLCTVCCQDLDYDRYAGEGGDYTCWVKW